MLSIWRQLILVFITSCLVPVLVSGKAPAQVIEPSPLPPQVLAVNALVAKYDHPDAPGVSVAVYRAGEVIYSRAVGMADLEHNVHLATGSVFDIASMSKQFTAMAVVLLHEDGRLSLDDEIQKFIPEVHAGAKKVAGNANSHDCRPGRELFRNACKSPNQYCLGVRRAWLGAYPSGQPRQHR